MTKSDSIKNIMTALGKFQAKALKVLKDSTNPHFKSKYASLAAVLDIIQPTLTDCHLVFTQIPDGTESLITTLFHTESGEYIEAPYKLNSVANTPQGIGSAITYARRYSLVSILGLNIDDDDDGNAASSGPNQQQQQQQRQQPPVPPAQPPVTLFNKQYTDGNAILAVIETAKNIKDELLPLYNANKETIEANPAIKAKFTAKKLSIENGGKLIITDKQLGQVMERISKGDLKVAESAFNTYVLTEVQKNAINTLVAEVKGINESVVLKYEHENDIINIIMLCKNSEQIMKLHSNNATIIDRTPEITTRLNAKLKELKSAA